MALHDDWKRTFCPPTAWTHPEAGGGAFGNTVSITLRYNVEDTLTHQLVHVAEWQASYGLDCFTSYVRELAWHEYDHSIHEISADAVEGAGHP